MGTNNLRTRWFDERGNCGWRSCEDVQDDSEAEAVAKKTASMLEMESVDDRKN